MKYRLELEIIERVGEMCEILKRARGAQRPIVACCSMLCSAEKG